MMGFWVLLATIALLLFYDIVVAQERRVNSSRSALEKAQREGRYLNRPVALYDTTDVERWARIYALVSLASRQQREGNISDSVQQNLQQQLRLQSNEELPDELAPIPANIIGLQQQLTTSNGKHSRQILRTMDSLVQQMVRHYKGMRADSVSR